MWYNFGASHLIPVRRCVGGKLSGILVGGHFQNLDWFYFLEVIFR